MIKESKINGFRFIAQTTYYMYCEGQEGPILTTSDPDLFESEKQKALSGKIAPNTETTRTKSIYENPKDKFQEAQNIIWDNVENIAEFKLKDTWPKCPTNYNVVSVGLVMKVIRELTQNKE